MLSGWFGRVVTMAALILALVVSLAMISGLSSERSVRRMEALSTVALSAGGPQVVSGPVVVVPFTRPKQQGQGTEDGYVLIRPETLRVDADITSEKRTKGIFEANILTARQTLSGEFRMPDLLRLDPLQSSAVAWGTPRLVVGVSDPRGIVGSPSVSWASKPLSVLPGTRMGSGLGFRGELPPWASGDEVVPFAVSLELRGTREMSWAPVGDETEISVRSGWPHPTFTGAFLPDTREVSDKGFTARWKTGLFATGLDVLDGTHLDGDSLALIDAKAFGVSFDQPVDIYRLTDRATKYGILFLVLSFGAFFLFEVLARLRIHPVQYALVGIAQAVFFVLLLSLGEHIPFQLAYLLATVASVGLMTAYATFVLGSGARAGLFGGCLLALYGTMDVLLLSEDFALLLGAGLLFFITGAAMFLTRRVDWEAFGAGKKSEPTGVPPTPTA